MISKANRLLISIMDHLPRIIPCTVQCNQGILCLECVCVCAHAYVCSGLSPCPPHHYFLYLSIFLFVFISLCVLAFGAGWWWLKPRLCAQWFIVPPCIIYTAPHKATVRHGILHGTTVTNCVYLCEISDGLIFKNTSPYCLHLFEQCNCTWQLVFHAMNLFNLARWQGRGILFSD